MRKKLSVLALIAILLLSLTACFDAKEVGDYAYVTMLGIDEGVSDKLRFTFHVPELSEAGSKNGGGGGDGKEKEEREYIGIESLSLLSSVSILNSGLPKVLNFMHLKAIVVSEDMAKSGFLGEIVASLIRYRQIRGTISMIICKGSAEDFVKASKAFQNDLVTETIEELTIRSESTGFIPNQNFREMYNRIKSTASQFLGNYGAINEGENLKVSNMEYKSGYKIPGDYLAGETPKKGGQKMELLGSAVFDGDIMVGTLTGFETQMVRLVVSNLKRAAFTIEDPLDSELIIPIEIKEFENPSIKIDLSEGAPKIQVKIRLEGDITSVASRQHYEDPKLKAELENSFEEFIEKGINRTFKKSVELKVDVFDFGRTAIRQFWTIPEWEEYSWGKKYPQSKLEVEVDFTIRRTGKIIESMPIISSEGKE